MEKPATPADEGLRLEALQGLRILDTRPEERFDRLTRIAQSLFHSQIALVSLVDADRQWFKSRRGLDETQTSRAISFCGHAILQDSAFVVLDASKDPRFVDNPLVTDNPKIRFYAGYPLKTTKGFNIGTLCVIDMKPRSFGGHERALLSDLAALVEDELRLTERGIELERALEAAINAQKESTHRETSMKQLTDAIIHDIGSPLTAINGLLTLLGDETMRGTREFDKVLHSCREAAQLLEYMHADLLSLSAGKIQIVFTAFSTEEFRHRLQLLFDIRAKRQSKTLRFELDPSVDGIKTDPMLVLRVMINLVGNALKYSARNSDIVVRSRREGGHVVFEVADSGPGVPDAYKTQVFEMFFRMERTLEESSLGTGIGLAFCAKAAASLGGKVWIEDAPGGGCLARFSIPI